MKLGLKRELEQDIASVHNWCQSYLREDGLSGALEACLDQATSSMGKGLRPIALLLAARFGPSFEKERQNLCKLAALVEMIHLASLVHDDIVDDSPIRRGKPTVQHRYGKDMAVYTGDFILSRVMQRMLKEGFYEEGLLLTECIEKMCIGEINQYENQFSTEATVEAYFQTVSGKTAAIFAAACRIGALRGGCDPDTAAALEEIGCTLGMAFQLKDDLKDFLSAEETEGKPVHADFKTGYYTLPVLCGFAHPGVGSRLKELAQLIPLNAHDASLLEEMTRLVFDSGGIAYAQSRVQEYVNRLKKLFDRLSDCEAKQMMKEILQ